MSSSHHRLVEFLNSPRSLNNRLIVQAYKKEALRATERNGFAFVDQKLALKGLTVLVDAKLSDNTFVGKGSTAYVKEEVLHTQQWAQKTMECDAIEGKFLIVDLQYVELITPPTGE
jgi:hypothetical protein